MSASPTQATETPARSEDQRRTALARANQVRAQRAALKAKLKRGELSIVTLIEEPPPYLASARISDLLMALPGLGPVKVGRLLERCQVSPRKTLAGLSERQRRELMEAIER